MAIKVYHLLFAEKILANRQGYSNFKDIFIRIFNLMRRFRSYCELNNFFSKNDVYVMANWQTYMNRE